MLPSTNLQDNNNSTTTQRFIEVCKKLERDKHLNKSEIFEQAFDVMKTEGFLSKQLQQSQKEAKSSSKLFSYSTGTDVEMSTVNISDIFKS